MTFGIIILAITRVFIAIVIDEITLRQNVKEKKRDPRTKSWRIPIFRREIAIKRTTITHPVRQTEEYGIIEAKSG